MDSGIETDSDTDAGRSSTSSEKQLYPWSHRSSRQLRELLRQRGQSTAGNKSILTSSLANSETTLSASTTSEATCSTDTAIHSEQTKAPFAFAEGETPRNPRSASRSRKPRTPKRTSSFSAHFADFINRRRVALETERQEISLYTSPLAVLSFFFLYLLHEFRMLLVWIVSQQYLLVILPVVCAILYVVYQTDGAHQPILEHAESGMIWYGYWILLGIASSVGLGTGLHTFILFLGPHIAEVTLAAYKFLCKSPEELAVPLTIYSIFGAVQWESFFWGLGTAIGELPPYFVARAAALSGNRNEELAAIEDLLMKKPDSVS
ncbi:Vacuolar membrane protease, partial [Mortierella alpina]